MTEVALGPGSEVLLSPICVTLSPDYIPYLPGYVARRLSITTMDPPPSRLNAGSYILYPRESKLQDQQVMASESEHQDQQAVASESEPQDQQAVASKLEPQDQQQALQLNSESIEFPAHKAPFAVEAPESSIDKSSFSSPTTQSTSRAPFSSLSVMPSLVEEDRWCRKRKIGDAHRTVSKKVHALNMEASKLMGSMLSSTLNEVEKLKLQLRVFDKYNQLGISRSVAAADLVEVAIITLGFDLRIAVGDDIVGQKVRRDELFGPGKVFWEGDIRDLNYTSCWWWMINGTQETLAQYWKKKGYNGPSLSTEWHASRRGKDRNARDTGQKFLKEYLQRAEMKFSKAVGLTEIQVHFCIGLFLCGPKLQRNKYVHLFGLWQLVRGSKAATRHGHESVDSINEHDAFRLSKAEQLCLQPKLEDFSIEELAVKKWVLDDVLNNLGELSPYYVQHAVEMRAIGSFVLKQMGKACGQIIWKIIASSAIPGVGEIYDIAGTHLKWDINCGITNGFCYCFLCKQQDAYLNVAIDEEGCWWKAVEGEWIEFQDVLNAVLIQ